MDLTLSLIKVFYKTDFLINLLLILIQRSLEVKEANRIREDTRKGKMFPAFQQVMPSFTKYCLQPLFCSFFRKTELEVISVG